MTLENLGEGNWQINIVETECALADEPAGLLLPFKTYTVLRVTSEKAAGAAATLNGILGRATNPATSTEYETTAAALVDEQPLRPTKARTGADGKVYWRTRPDVGADNTVTSSVRIREGWDEEQ